jgi:acyl dehydratase
VADSVHLRIRKLPSGLGSYPRVLFTPRPPVTEVVEPPEFHASVSGVRLAEKDARRYAAMCGFGEAVPVTFPHMLAMPLHLQIFACRAFPLRPMGLIHLANQIEPLVGLRPGMLLDIGVSARNYQRTDAGITFDMATEIASDGRPVWRETCVFLTRWPESADRPASRPPRPPKAPKDAAVLAEFEVTRGTARDYAWVSKDFNPIHLSDRAARFFGLRGSISHGMWSLARTLSQGPAPTFRDGIRIETQFLTPVQIPARVAIKEWSAEGQRRRALCDIRTGRVHMYAYWPEEPAAA